MESQTAKCHICKSTLPMDSFHKDCSKRSGYSNKCKACKLKKSAEYRKAIDWAAYMRERLKDDAKRTAYNSQQVAWRKRNSIAARAYNALHNAIKNGSVVKPIACSDCGQVRDLEAHHDDYTKPLDVAWLCKSCHEARHHTNCLLSERAGNGILN